MNRVASPSFFIHAWDWHCQSANSTVVVLLVHYTFIALS